MSAHLTLEEAPRRIGRPPSCVCGTCPKCRQRVRARKEYDRRTPEERRARIARRDREAMHRAEVRRSGTPRRRASLREASKRAHQRDPEKTAARAAVRRALASGRLERRPCMECGGGAEAHHHLGYAREHWLHVEWHCRQHHHAIHDAAAAAS